MVRIILLATAIVLPTATARAAPVRTFSWPYMAPQIKPLRACLADMKKIIELRRDILAGPDGTGDPQIDDSGVALNGIGAAAAQPFLFPGEIRVLNFCRTRGKPYDEVVAACLLAAREHFLPPLLDLGGDSENKQVDDGLDLFRQALGRDPRPPAHPGFEYDEDGYLWHGSPSRRNDYRGTWWLNLMISLGVLVAVVIITRRFS